MEQLIFSPQSLGQALRRQRKAKALNQKKAGELFNLGQNTISNIEMGAPGTRIETLFRLLAALDLEMVLRSKPMPKKKQSGDW